MKHFFKYANGYINIDNENLYLTNSGNWQEARGLEEKSKETIKANNARTGNMRGFVYSMIGLACSAIFLMFDNKKVSFGIVLLIGVLAWKALDYMKGEFGNRYKIPLSKLEGVAQQGSTLKIHFRNAAGEPDTETISNLSPSGIDFLLQLTRETTSPIRNFLKNT